MDDPITFIARELGATPIQVFVTLFVLSTICNIVGRLIPDDATGFLGLVRKASKVLGLYVSKRVTSGVSTDDVARAAVGVPAKPETVVAMQDSGALPPPAPTPEPSTFRSPALVSLLACALILLPLLAACATVDKGIDSVRAFICSHQSQTLAAANAAIIGAQSIHDANARAAVILAANANISIVNSCPKE